VLAEVERSKLVSYCKSMSPLEAGGYIDSNGCFVPCPNMHPKPDESFLFNNVPADAVAIVHSHPGGPFCPSEADQLQQQAWGVPWLIVAFDDTRTELFAFGDEAPKLSLLNRGFRHFVSDCYAGARDLYEFECGLVLPQFVRSWEWWNRSDNLFESGFESAGFVQTSGEELLPGDALLMALPRGETINHCAIWVGDGLIYHHTSGKTESDPNRLATVELAGRYFRYTRKVVRHADCRIARTFGEKIRAQVRI